MKLVDWWTKKSSTIRKISIQDIFRSKTTLQTCKNINPEYYFSNIKNETTN